MIIIDVETTALSKHCCVLSIGAISFNPDGKVKDLKDASKFHKHISFLSQYRQGRIFDENTIKWLNKQPQAVRANAFKSATSKLDLSDAFQQLADWMSNQNAFDGNCHVRGVDFEGTILPDIAKQYGIRFPVNFSGYNDIRTLIRDYVNTTSSYIETEMMHPDAQEMMLPLVKHIAIDDCIIDAIQIIEGRRIRNMRLVTDSNVNELEVNKRAICKILNISGDMDDITLIGKDLHTTHGALDYITAHGGEELSACEFLDIATAE